MASIVIGTVNETLMPGASVTYNTDGTITADAKYAYLQSQTPSPIGKTHPDDSAAVCIAYTISFDETHQYAQLRYRGVWSNSACRVDIQAGLQAAPIETHPNFVSSLGGTPASPLNDAVFDDNGVFLGWPAGAPSNLGGVRFFLQVANSYRFTFSTTSGATVAAALGGLGGISSSVSAGGLTVSQSNGFMLQNVTEEHEFVGTTTVYTFSQVFVSTTPPGWNTAIYPP